MESMDRSDTDRRTFERRIIGRGFFFTGRKMDNAEIWENHSGDGHVFQLDHIGIFHYIGGKRIKGVSWDRVAKYEF